MVTEALAEPEVVGCFFADCFQPRLLAMRLNWRGNVAAVRSQEWPLPQGVTITGPAPGRFGIEVHRQNTDEYAVRMLWDATCFGWIGVTRSQLLNSCLTSLLASMGTDLHYLLEQPVDSHADPGFLLKVG